MADFRITNGNAILSGQVQLPGFVPIIYFMRANSIPLCFKKMPPFITVEISVNTEGFNTLSAVFSAQGGLDSWGLGR
jgi:hypothetical protein